MAEPEYLVLKWNGTGRLCLGRVKGDTVVGVWFSDGSADVGATWPRARWDQYDRHTVGTLVSHPDTETVERFLMAAAMGVYYPIPEWGLTEERICQLSTS